MINLLEDYVSFWQARTTLNSLRPQISELLRYKFTNPYRISDRGSQVTFQQIISNPRLSQNEEEVLFRLFIHLHFNTQKFADKLIAYDLKMSSDLLDFNEYLQKDKDKLFSGAYMTLPLNGDKDRVESMCKKANNFVKAFNNGQISLKNSQELFNSLKRLQGMGDFLSSQIVFDYEWFNESFSREPLYALGCGAVRGAWKLGLQGTPKEILEKLKIVWSENMSDYLLMNRLPLPSDLQNTLCETDKAFRMLHPAITKNGYPSAKLKLYKSKGGINSFKAEYPLFWNQQ